MNQEEAILALIRTAELILRKRMARRGGRHDINGYTGEDFVQITALKLLEYAQRNGVPLPSVAYVVKIGLNAGSDIARKSTPENLSQELLDAAAGREADPAEAVEREEERLLLCSALASMRLQDREIIGLRVFEEQSFERIARDLGEATDAVRSRFYRAVQRLRLKMRVLLQPRLARVI